MSKSGKKVIEVMVERMLLKQFDFTTKLNIRIICIVLFFTVSVSVYNHWISLLAEKKAAVAELENITAFLATKLAEDCLGDIIKKQDAEEMPVEEQIMLVNQVIQPVLSNVLAPNPAMKYGFYSKHYQRVVAVAPYFDKSLLVDFDSEKYENMYSNNTPVLMEKDKSVVCYGAPIMYHMRPVIINGEVAGHVFAALDMNAFYREWWSRTIKSLLYGMVALLIVIMLFQEQFVKLKKELNLFADSIIKGRARNFESNIPELTPVLQYISEQTDKMARLDRLNTIGEMAASIGHEVRNPMTTVRGFLQYLSTKKELDGYRGHFKIMIEEMDRANAIISEFLSLAKNKAMHFKVVNLNAMIEEVAPLIQADAFRHNCQVKFDLKSVINILADEGSIRQLLFNMVRNALEAMPAGGVVRIRTQDCGNKSVLLIEDEGIGMPSDLMDKLGIPFFTTKENGIGLGLAICYQIVQRHNATIAVDSKPKQGTSFAVTFAAEETGTVKEVIK